jgi:uncharacterized protein
MSVQRLTASDFRRLPWANGRGSTLELVRRDDATGALLWRLSVADVVEPGPFSPLPGIDRAITLIDGGGFVLDFGGMRPSVALRPFEPLAFSGDWPTVAIAVHGPSRDFNVMTARGRIVAEVSVSTGGVVTGPLAYIFAARGSLTFETAGTLIRAESGELIECRQESIGRLEASPGSVAIVVRLQATNGASLP